VRRADAAHAGVASRLDDWTVVDLIRTLGFEVENELSWCAGNRVRDAWLLKTGDLPEKRLRGKSHARGSHCFAVYPRHFRAQALEIVQATADELYSARASQLGLFIE
jgi:hypothetical protein